MQRVLTPSEVTAVWAGGMEPVPINPWVLGAAVSPIAIPLGQVLGVLRAKPAEMASVGITSGQG